MTVRVTRFRKLPCGLFARDETTRTPIQEDQAASRCGLVLLDEAIVFTLLRQRRASAWSIRTWETSAGNSVDLSYPLQPIERAVTPCVILRGASTGGVVCVVEAESITWGDSVSRTVEVPYQPQLYELPELLVGAEVPALPTVETIRFTVTPSDTPDIVVLGVGVVQIPTAEMHLP